MNKRRYYEDYVSEHYSMSEYARERSREYFSFKLDQAVPELKDFWQDAKVLDLGCGFGKFAYYCSDHGYLDYTGVDVSSECINLCRDEFAAYFDFVESDILDYLRECSETFDLVVMSHVLEHFTREEAHALLEKIDDVLSEDGVFLNIMPNGHSYIGGVGSRYNDLTHEMMYTARSFDQLLHKVFSGVVWEHRNYVVGEWWWERWGHNVAYYVFVGFIQALGYPRRRVYTKSFITLVENTGEKRCGA